jgi:hypothetical protein
MPTPVVKGRAGSALQGTPDFFYSVQEMIDFAPRPIPCDSLSTWHEG